METASVFGQIEDEIIKLFAIHKIIDITKSSGFISDLEMEALYRVGKLVGLSSHTIDQATTQSVESF